MKLRSKISGNTVPERVSSQCYLRLITSLIQFFNIKYDLVILASLLRKIKIFKSIKPLKFAAIYADLNGKNDRVDYV